MIGGHWASVLSAIAVCLGLAACGGGGSGGGSGGGNAGRAGGADPITAADIQPASLFVPDTRIEISSGNAIEYSSRFTFSPIGGGRAMIAAFPRDRYVNNRLAIVVDQRGVPRTAQLFAIGHRIDLDTSAADTVAFRVLDPRFVGIERRAGLTARRAFFFGGNPGALEGIYLADPVAFDLQHLTFGMWGWFPNDVDLDVGLGAFGRLTSLDRMPRSGNAVYRGGLLGAAYLATPAASAVDVSADVRLEADFGAGDMVLQTSATRSLTDNSPIPNLDINGAALRIANFEFRGDATTRSGWTGDVRGRFYGPEAEEVGGVFDLRGVGLERYVATFGATR